MRFTGSETDVFLKYALIPQSGIGQNQSRNGKTEMEY